jgi:hypothetical protein
VPLSRFRALVATALLPGSLLVCASGPADAQITAAPRQISYRQWDTAAELATGVLSGASRTAGSLRLGAPTSRVRVDGRPYDRGTWTSPWVRPAFRLTELVASWSATTPPDTLIQVDVRGVGPRGTRSSWDTLARWAGPDATFARTSLGAQRDDLAHVATDTWEADQGLSGWQTRVSLLRRTGTTATPLVRTIGAVASRLPDVDRVARSQPGIARGVVLPVPRYSQMVHAGEYPRYGGGGEAWCSPTATTMVLAYYRRLPPPSDYAWVRRSYPDRVVDHSARMTFDRGYDGTGNWAFNTAYAASRTGSAFVTRFASLRGVERLVRAGIPVVTSITFGSGELDGAPISATNGHLVVVLGFTSAGDVVVNDPAARTNAGVRRTYARGQFENAWLARRSTGHGMRGSGGIGYVIRDAAHPLPARAGGTSW